MTPERTIDGAAWAKALPAARKRRAEQGQRTREAIRLAESGLSRHIRAIGQPANAEAKRGTKD